MPEPLTLIRNRKGAKAPAPLVRFFPRFVQVGPKMSLGDGRVRIILRDAELGLSKWSTDRPNGGDGGEVRYIFTSGSVAPTANTDPEDCYAFKNEDTPAFKRSVSDRVLARLLADPRTAEILMNREREAMAQSATAQKATSQRGTVADVGA